MVLIVGLGNPGRKFINTRHNVGFRVLDEFLTGNTFPEFKLLKKFNVLISQGIFGDNEIILVKPQTFMNESGKAVKKIVRNWKATLQGVRLAGREIGNLFVVHDDLNLPLGKIKIVRNRGAAGHKGVQSIINELGTKNFVRFRVGIKPSVQSPLRVGVEKEGLQKEKTKQAYGTVYRSGIFVLENFSKEEKKILKKIIKKTEKAIEMALKEGVEKTMNQFNQ